MSNVATTPAWSEGHNPDGVRSADVFPTRAAPDTVTPLRTSTKSMRSDGVEVAVKGSSPCRGHVKPGSVETSVQASWRPELVSLLYVAVVSGPPDAAELKSPAITSGIVVFAGPCRSSTACASCMAAEAASRWVVMKRYDVPRIFASTAIHPRGTVTGPTRVGTMSSAL